MFKGYKLVTGVMKFEDLVEEIAADSPKIFGYFFPRDAVSTGTSFHVVQ